MALLFFLSAPLAAVEKGAGGVTFNFVDVDIAAVAKFVSEVTGKNLIFDERVRGKITIIAPSPLGRDDSFRLFSSVLSLKGFTLLPSGVNAYKIVPDSEARQSGMAVTTERPPVDESYIARLIPLRYISSEDALRFLQPVISKTGYISSFGPGNVLLVVDSGLNIEKVLKIVENIDVAAIEEEPEVVFLEQSSADAVAQLLNEGLQKKVRRPEEEASRAVADKRLNAVVLFGPRGDKDLMKRLIGQLDVSAKAAQGVINVYFLENADAEAMAEVLDRLLRGEPRTPGQPGTVSPARSPFLSSASISVTPDKATNSLVIIASPADYQSIAQVITQLDKRRRQVFVEAMIIEASIDRLKELGSKWRVTGKHKGSPVAIGGVGTIDNTAIQTIISGLTGLSVGGVGTNLTVPVTQPDGSTTEISVPGFAALFSLSEFEGAVDILSNPQILTSDNTEAEIHVGENVPFISKRERDVTTTNTVLSSIERKDVGITLRITPQITEGDFVNLDIYQEISSVRDSSEEVFTTVGPTTTKRSTKTSVSVKDGQTVVIGGLMQERQENTETRVPGLHRIPLLGWLFKFRTSSRVKTNLLVFITPHIVKGAEALAGITERKKAEYAKRENIYAEGELLVRFKPGVEDEKAVSIIEQQKASVIKRFEGLGLYHIRLAEGADIEEAIEDFTSLPEVKYAEPNYVLDIDRAPAAGRQIGIE